jgi:hypothetical protein
MARGQSDKLYVETYRRKLSVGFQILWATIESALRDNPQLITELNVPQTLLAEISQMDSLDDPSHKARIMKGTRAESLEYAARIIRLVPTGITRYIGDLINRMSFQKSQCNQ